LNLRHRRFNSGGDALLDAPEAEAERGQGWRGWGVFVNLGALAGDESFSFSHTCQGREGSGSELCNGLCSASNKWSRDISAFAR
jgi:hypothetical protein